VPDHPQYAMWKARHQAEQAAAQERAARRAARDAQQARWKGAWEEYKGHWMEGVSAGRLPPWWHLRSWLRILFGKSRPRV
jgi:hypothetical protein